MTETAGVAELISISPDHRWFLGNTYRELPQGMSRLTTAAKQRMQQLALGKTNRTALSSRESYIVERTIIEFSYDAVAAQLGISPNTVRTHNARARHKYGVNTADEFILNATLTGEIDGSKILRELWQKRNVAFLPSLHSRAQDLLTLVGESTAYLNPELVAEELSLSPLTIRKYWERYIRGPYGLQNEKQTLVFLGELMKQLTGDQDQYFDTSFKNIESEKPKGILSFQEILVATHYAQGSRTTRIAEIMGISPETVKTYFRRISKKLGASGIVGAMQAFQQGIAFVPLT